MPRARKTQKNAGKTNIVEPCKIVGTNKRKPSATDGSAAPSKKSKKGMKTIAVDTPVKINTSVETDSQEVEFIEAPSAVEKKTKKGNKAAALKKPISAKVGEGEAISDGQQVLKEPTIPAGKPKKGAKKTAALGESSVITQDQIKIVEAAKALNKNKKGSMVSEAAEKPNTELVMQEEPEIMNKDELAEVPEKKTRKGGSRTGETKKPMNAEHQVGSGSEKKVKKKAKSADGKKIGKTMKSEPIAELPQKEGANEAGSVVEEVSKKKGRKQPAVKKPTDGIAVGKTEEKKDVTDGLTTVAPKPKEGRKPTATKKQANAANSAIETEQTSLTIYDFTVKDADDNDVSLAKYKGHPVLIVNVASRCGHTKKNYTQLKELYDKYKDQGLRIATFPCNQFGGQEPGVATEIKRNIAQKYGFEPDFYAKISVNGAGADPLYKFLKNKQGNNEAITWNFAKFLVDKDGYVVKRYLPKIQPKDITDDIETLLGGGKL